jgi:hypothetical protein
LDCRSSVYQEKVVIPLDPQGSSLIIWVEVYVAAVTACKNILSTLKSMPAAMAGRGRLK